jgi:uncharacterized protein
MNSSFSTHAKVSLPWHALVLVLALLPALADDKPQKIPLVQDWSTPSLITTKNDWSGVPGFVGYRGDKLANKPGLNPQTLTADGMDAPVDVIANQKTPTALRTGGVAEFDGLPNPTVALKGSATASAPFLLLHLDTRGKRNITVGYKLRDLDGSANNAVQAVALQYRAQTNAAFTDIPAAYAPDATTGPSLATLVTPIVVVLPADADDQPAVQLRWISANAEGNDEWVGLDDIAIIADDTTPTAARDSSLEKMQKAIRNETAPTN